MAQRRKRHSKPSAAKAIAACKAVGNHMADYDSDGHCMFCDQKDPESDGVLIPKRR